jgi:hypothetical protein
MGDFESLWGLASIGRTAALDRGDQHEREMVYAQGDVSILRICDNH